MDAATLREAMGRDLPTGKYPTLVADYNTALVAAGCTTVNRAAMFAAQIGHESLGLVYFEEIASGDAYEGRRDLGNTERGDGRRYKGRGPIQLTGRANYRAFTDWCRSRGYGAPDFVADPAAVATSRWGFLAASWYWTVARPKINGLCDAADLTGVTRQINGGTHGLADRRARFDRCRRLGDRVLATAPAASSTGGGCAYGARDDAATLAWQTWLRDTFPAYAGALRPDGDYGDATMRATAEFQRRVRITGPDADGRTVGPRTLAAARELGYRG